MQEGFDWQEQFSVLNDQLQGVEDAEGLDPESQVIHTDTGLMNSQANRRQQI